MAKEQRLITPLVESGIQVEPPTPPSMGLNTRIQRAWSMLFGRRENTLQPVYASRGGMLGVVPLDLNGWTMVYHDDPTTGWANFGQIVDLVFYSGLDLTMVAPYLEFGPDGVNTTHIVTPTVYSIGFDGEANIQVVSGYAHVRSRYMKGTGCFESGGMVAAYTAPKR